MQNFVPFDWVIRHSMGATRQGMNFDALMSLSMIKSANGNISDVITTPQWLLLCLNTSLGLNDATHGLAKNGFASGFTLIGLRSFKGCGTLEAAIRTLQYLYSLTSNSIRINLETSQDQAILSIEADCPDDKDRAVLEDTYLGWIYMHCVYFLGRSLPVISVTTIDTSHFNMGYSHYVIGAPTRHGQCSSMRFAKSYLSHKGTNGTDKNPHWECFRLWFECCQNISDDQSLIFGRDKVPLPRIQDLASEAGVSRTTVYRRLLASDGGVRLQRQRTISQAAVKMLRETDDCVEAIGAQLGYADGRSFRRFLKSATGKTPTEIRESVKCEYTGIEDRARLRLRELCNEMGF